MNRSGYSTAELLVALGLLGLLLLLGTMNFKGAPQRASVRSAAEQIASELRATRDQAISRGHPTAMVFPKVSGEDFGQGFYRLRGRSQPDLISIRDLGEEHQGVGIFVGFWTLDSGSNQADPDEFSAVVWGSPRPEDAHIQFLASGEVRSDQPSFDNAFHIVVAQGIEATSADVSGVSSRRLQKAADAYTVTVGKSGQVKVSKGVLKGGSVDTQSAPVPVIGGLPTLPANESNSSPTNLTVEAFPVPVNETLPPGIDAVVKQKGTLTLHTEADDSNGDPLVCVWQCDRPGGFSTEQPVEMVWNGSRWQATYEWGPEEGAQPNDIYTLTCRIEDGRGGLVEGQVGAAGLVQILPRGRMVFTSDRDGNFNVYTMNEDGTDLRQLTDDPADETFANWTRDGSMITFTSTRTGRSEIWIMNYDGTGQRAITDSPSAGLSAAVWPAPDPGGYRVAFWGMSGGRMGVYVITTEGTHPDNPSLRKPKFLGGNWTGDLTYVPANNPVTGRGLDWHPNGDYILAGGGDLIENGRAAGIYEFAADGSTMSKISNLPGHATEPDCSPDGSQVVYTRTGEIVVNNYSPGSLTPIRTLQVAPRESAQFSPDGQRIVTQGFGPPGGRKIFTMDLNGGNIRQLTHATGSDDSAHWTFR
jgi:type II secretory pathway pseudopilin PulG